MQRPTSNDELKLLIATKLDVTEFLDLLGWDMYDLVEALDETIADNYEELIKYLD